MEASVLCVYICTLSMCVCICVYMYICVCVYIHVHMCVHVCTNALMCIWMNLVVFSVLVCPVFQNGQRRKHKK